MSSRMNPRKYFQVAAAIAFCALWHAAPSLAQLPGNITPLHAVTLVNNTGAPVNDLHVTFNGRPSGLGLLNVGWPGYMGEVGGSAYRSWPSSQGWTVNNGGSARVTWREGAVNPRATAIDTARWTVDGTEVGDATMQKAGLDVLPGSDGTAVVRMTNESYEPMLFSGLSLVRDNSLGNFTEQAFAMTTGQVVPSMTDVVVLPGMSQDVSFGPVDPNLYQFARANVSVFSDPESLYPIATGAVVPEPASLAMVLLTLLSPIIRRSTPVLCRALAGL